jgi:hypothetical protein
VASSVGFTRALQGGFFFASAIYLAVAPGFGGRIFVGERYYTLDRAAPSLCGRQRPSGV